MAGLSIVLSAVRSPNKAPVVPPIAPPTTERPIKLPVLVLVVVLLWMELKALTKSIDTLFAVVEVTLQSRISPNSYILLLIRSLRLSTSTITYPSLYDIDFFYPSPSDCKYSAVLSSLNSLL